VVDEAKPLERCLPYLLLLFQVVSNNCQATIISPARR
jgi:hypothetical protein